MGDWTQPSSAAPAAALNAKQRLWLPTGGIDESLPRGMATMYLAALLSGQLYLAGGLVIPAGQQVNTITFVSGSTALAAGTHQWFALVRQTDRAVLAKTNNDGAAPWPATTAKTLTLAAPYTPSEDVAVYAGIVVVATTMPTLAAQGGAAVIASAIGDPQLGGLSTPGLTDPPSLAGTAAAPTGWSGLPYVVLR